MARILITSGPTRQYIDPVRFISNASSGRMGREVAAAAIRAGHEVIVVSGPVNLNYPKSCQVIDVETTTEMMEACELRFPECDGLIGVAAPCDYQPARVSSQKISKSGEPLLLELIETPDIVATLGRRKTERQWTVGFALETGDIRFRAISKLQRKLCNLVVANSAAAINARSSRVEIIAQGGSVLETCAGSKAKIARTIIRIISEHLL